MLVRSWVLAKEGIYFAADGSRHGTRTGDFSFSTGAVSEIAALEREPVRAYPALAISPDGLRLLCALSEPDRVDIMLVEKLPVKALDCGSLRPPCIAERCFEGSQGIYPLDHETVNSTASR